MIIGEKSIIDVKINDKLLNQINNTEWITTIIFSDKIIDYVLLVADKLIDDKKYYIKLNISKLYDLDLLQKIYDINPKIEILYGFEDVSIDLFINTCKKLDNLVKPIESLNLSPFEKFIYVFNIASKIKEYKYEEWQEDKSGSIFELLDEDNDLIVCLGFSKLLEELCKRVNIKCKKIYVDLNDSTSYEAHVRNIGRIIDDKYGIDGIYIFDSTFANSTTEDLYVTACMTPFESLNTNNDTVKFGTYIDILSSQSYDEFIHVISKDSVNNYKKFNDTIKILIYLYPEFNEIINNDIYNNLKNIDNPNKDDYYKLFSDDVFMHKVYDFIYSKCNSSINGLSIIDAACNVYGKLNPDLKDKKLKEYRNNLIKSNSNNFDDLYLYVREFDNAYVYDYIDDRKNSFKC